MKLKTFLKYCLKTNWIKTIRMNCYYFSLNDALRFPILVAYRTKILQLEGGVEIKGPMKMGMLRIGYYGVGSIDPSLERTIWQVSGKIKLNGEHIGIGRGTRFCISGVCEFGDNFEISGRSTLICHHKMLFGNNVLLSWDVLLMDTDYHTITNETGDILNKDKPIIIGDNVWVGCRSTILKGATIPSESVIAACSIVSGPMKEGNCVYSSGRKIIHKGINWRK